MLDVELGKLAQRLARQGVRLQVDEAVKHAICRAHDSRFGARDLSRRLRTRLEPALAEALLRDPAEQVWRAVLQDGAIRVEPLASD